MRASVLEYSSRLRDASTSWHTSAYPYYTWRGQKKGVVERSGGGGQIKHVAACDACLKFFLEREGWIHNVFPSSPQHHTVLGETISTVWTILSS